MKNPTISFGLILFFLPFLTFSQNLDYESVLVGYKKQLSEEHSISESFIHKDFYKNGTIKNIGLYVKYKNDSLDRFFNVGEYFEFYKNGKLRQTSKTDLFTINKVDTAISYSKSGKVKSYLIYYNISNSKKNEIEFKISINEKFWVEKSFAYIDKGFNWKIEKIIAENKIIYNKIPNQVFKQIYINGFLDQSFEGDYNSFLEGYTQRGDLIHYKQDGSILSISPQIERVNFKQITLPEYSGENSQEIIDFINKKIESYKKSPFVKIDMPYSNYVFKGVKTNCFLYGFDNIFIIAKKDNLYSILTSNELDSYYQNNKSYVKSCTGDKCYFIEKMQSGKIELFYKSSILGDFGNIYYLKEHDSPVCYILLPDNKMIFAKDQYINRLTIENQSLEIEFSLGEEKIIKTLLSIPEFGLFIQKKLDLGLYSYNDLNNIVAEFNMNNNR